MIEIPEITDFGEAYYEKLNSPGWFQPTTREGVKCKPVIRCNCGRLCGIGLHYVHADGTVTASFYHKKGTTPPEDPNGCEWHVFLKLKDYNGGEFPPTS